MKLYQNLHKKVKNLQLFKMDQNIMQSLQLSNQQKLGY